MATPRNARLAPVALALIAALASTACQRQSADDASTGAAPDAPAAPVEPAASAAAPEPTMVAPIAFDCGGTAVQASFDGDNATVLIDGETIALATVPAASGARYQGTRADGVAVELWTKGEGATLSVAGNAYPDCTKAASDAAPAQAAYRARGNEPFWSIEASDDELRWTTPDTPDAVVWSGVARTDRADGFDLAATRDGATLTLAATATLCRDNMTGMPYPHTVTVRVGETDYRGCGGEALELLTANEWTVTTLGGTAAGERPPTLQFTADGRANGFAGCNRWMSGAALSGEGLAFDRAASTMMACPDDAMQAERAFLDALSKVTRHDFDEAGNLLLKAGDETVIVAAKAAPAETPAG